MAAGWFLQVIAAVLSLAIPCAAFSSSCHPRSIRGRTRLGSQFINGGYDASVVASAKWSPLEAAEFVIWHSCQPDAVGRQLHPLVQTWGGEEVGEFVTRLYLTEKHEHHLAMESRHVRTPQWHGLEDDPGLEALHNLLQTTLPDAVLEDPMELARFANLFLWREHTWPTAADVADEDATTPSTSSTQPPLQRNNKSLESDSFASLGYTEPIVQIWKQLRQQRFELQQVLQRPLHYNGKDLVQIALEQTLASTKKTTSLLPFEAMQQFFRVLDIHVKPTEKVNIVQGLAKGGWTPANIARFVSIIPEARPHHEDVTLKTSITQRRMPRRGKKKKQGATTTTTSFSVSAEWSTVPPAVQSNMSSSLWMLPECNQTIPYFGVTHEYFATSMEQQQHHHHLD
jgi:hypothetical protein